MAALIEFGALIRVSDSALTAFLGVLGRRLIAALFAALICTHSSVPLLHFFRNDGGER